MKHLILTTLCLFGILFIQASNKDSAWYYFNKGLTEKQVGHLLEASKAFEVAASYDASHIDALTENAFCCLKMRKLDKAKLCFEKIIELQPFNIKASQELARIYFDYRQFEKAIKFAGNCNAWSEKYRIIGISQYWLEDYPQAEKALLIALAQLPADADLNYFLARTYVDIEDYKKATVYYEKAVASNEVKSSWMNELAILYFTVDDYRKSADMFQQALDKGFVPSNDFNENFGFASLYAGDFDKGEQLLMNIWQRKPNSKDLLRDMAEILYKKGETSRSMLYCQKLMELDPNDGKALFQAGLNFIKAGEKSKGQQMCDKAISIDPSLAGHRQKKEIM